MPIYEYRCLTCDHQLELMQKISDTPLTNCPKCGKSSLEKIISSAQFQLKGGGWYVTDFKRNDQVKTQKDSQSEGGSKGEKKQEPTPTPTESK